MEDNNITIYQEEIETLTGTTEFYVTEEAKKAYGGYGDFLDVRGRLAETPDTELNSADMHILRIWQDRDGFELSSAECVYDDTTEPWNNEYRVTFTEEGWKEFMDIK